MSVERTEPGRRRGPDGRGERDERKLGSGDECEGLVGREHLKKTRGKGLALPRADDRAKGRCVYSRRKRK